MTGSVGSDYFADLEGTTLKGTTFYYYILVEQRLSPDYGLKLADDLIERMDVIFVGNGFIFDYKSYLKMVVVSIYVQRSFQPVSFLCFYPLHP